LNITQNIPAKMIFYRPTERTTWPTERTNTKSYVDQCSKS